MYAYIVIMHKCRINNVYRGGDMIFSCYMQYLGGITKENIIQITQYFVMK